MFRKFKPLVIGCGNIGSKFDEVENTHKSQLTHLGNLIRHKSFFDYSCVDNDKERLNECASFWNIKNKYDSIDSIDEKNVFDVISICTPTEHHINDIFQSTKFNPKLIFCEKPISYDLNKTKEVIKFLKKKNINLCINYSRRWDPLIYLLKENIKNEKFGKFITGQCIYNRGLYNNGSHLIDLLINLFEDIKVISVGKPYNYFELDPTVSFNIETKNNSPIFVNVMPSNQYSCFELKLFFEEKVISIESGGNIWKTQKIVGSDFKGFKNIANKTDQLKGNSLNLMGNAFDNIYDHLSNNALLKCSFKEALLTEEICNEIKNFN